MSHTCPECGMLCFCNGDIDDCCNNFPKDVDNCIHWIECQRPAEENYEDDE
jgi:hypothetical protein